MRTAFFCQFPPNTANGILMADRTATARAAGCEAALYTLTFRDTAGRLRPLSLLRVPGIAWRMRRADVVIVQKPLPLGVVLCLALRALRYRGQLYMIYDDWEGVGGFASTRSRGLWARMLVTFCEELAPYLVTMNICVSDVLFRRLLLHPRGQGRTIRTYNGGMEL